MIGLDLDVQPLLGELLGGDFDDEDALGVATIRRLRQGLSFPGRQNRPFHEDRRPFDRLAGHFVLHPAGVDLGLFLL